MKNYLFLNFQNLLITDELLFKIKEYKSIHLNFNFNTTDYQINEYFNLFDKIKTNNPYSTIYVYAYNINCVLAAKKYNLLIHYCFLNEDISIHKSIHNEFYLSMIKDIESEIFWVIDDDIFNYSVDDIILWLQQLNRPVCPSFNGNLLQSLKISSYQNLRDLIQKIQVKFKNPLFAKEKNLNVSSWRDNDYIDNIDVITHSFVMGIFGDLIVKNKSPIEHINLKTLLRNSECKNCSYLDNCSIRGIGYIMSELKLTNCCSYNLFQQISNDNQK